MTNRMEDCGKVGLATPLIVRTTVTHGISLFDANGSSLAVDFEQHTADEVARRCNSHDALTAQVAAMQAVVNVASILENAWHGETEADTTDVEMALWDAIKAYRETLKVTK
jgi:hypothetical protein